jgi:D-apiose dehydrogenase
MAKLRFAILGTGFWANYQIPAWMELEGIELVALYNRTKSKAEALAEGYSIPGIYDDAQALLNKEKIDFVDIITDVDSHALLTKMAAKKGVAVICQKPMAPKLPQAKEMVEACERAGVPFFIHENWRWQAPLRRVKEILQSNVIGKIFKAGVTFCSGFPVFVNQPFLTELDEFILTDIGSHILDTCRFLFGEAQTLYCQTSTVNPKIKGEDVANVFMKMKNGISCYAEMSYASILEYEPFPQTFLLIEGSQGSIQLMKDYSIHVTTKSGTSIETAKPKMYSWLDPAYALVHSSIVDCNRDILMALQGKHKAETTGADNLETVRLVHAAYNSAKNNRVIDLGTFA